MTNEIPPPRGGWGNSPVYSQMLRNSVGSDLDETFVEFRRSRVSLYGMEGERRAIQAMDWSPEGKRRRGRSRKNWQETIGLCEDIL